MPHLSPDTCICFVKDKAAKKDRAAVDYVYFLRISKIIRIMVPRWFCKEVGLLWLGCCCYRPIWSHIEQKKKNNKLRGVPSSIL